MHKERFIKFFDATNPLACWEWRGVRDRKGYGKFWWSVAARFKLAHRASWGFFVGKIPKGLCVLHKCDNPPCVNPAHLFIGTVADNNKDCAAKGRIAKRFGESNVHHKLTSAQVKEIRASTEKQRDIAQKFGLHQSQVSRIKAGHRWAHTR